MAEAIFAKYGGGSSIPAELRISNYTKFALGLNANATLDDCLRKINSIDANTGLAIVTLKDVDGAPLGDHNIRITDAGGLNVIYTTDGMGQCSFKTINGVANFYDESNLGWFDLVHQNALNVNIPIGSVQQITLQRQKKYNNGDTISASGWCNFSKFADKADVEIKSGDGGRSFSGKAFNLRGYANKNYLHFNDYNYSFEMNIKYGNVTINGYITGDTKEYRWANSRLNYNFTISRTGSREYNRINSISLQSRNVLASLSASYLNIPSTDLNIFTGNNASDVSDDYLNDMKAQFYYRFPYKKNANRSWVYDIDPPFDVIQVFSARLNTSTVPRSTGITSFGNFLAVNGGSGAVITESKSWPATINILIQKQNVSIVNNGLLQWPSRSIMGNLRVEFKPELRGNPFNINDPEINLINFQYK